MIQHRELEQKLADAKLEQASAILMEEKGKNQKEKELVMSSSRKNTLHLDINHMFWNTLSLTLVCVIRVTPSSLWFNFS